MNGDGSGRARERGPFVLDDSYRRTAGGSVVIAGSPLRLFRLTAAGRAVADALEAGRPLPRNHAALTDRLLDAGAIHPLPGRSHARPLPT